MAAGDVGARFRELAMRHPSLAWPSSTAVGWRIGSAGSDDVAAVTDPFASAYAGIDPSSPLLCCGGRGYELPAAARTRRR
jgi:hypothetical protein